MMKAAARHDTRRSRAYVAYLVADARKAPLPMDYYDGQLAASAKEAADAKDAFWASMKGYSNEYISKLALEAAAGC